MRTPVRGAFVSLVVNAILSVCSLLYLGEWALLGLAAANVLAAVLQAAYLLKKFSSHEERSPLGLRLGLGSVCGACVLLGLVTWGGWEWISSLGEISPKGRSAVAVFALIPVAVGAYFFALGRLRFPDAALLRGMVTRDRS
jgi:peptidoglycan biosynthesis protein MviN/MurJ (putative lipid II flippase)